MSCSEVTVATARKSGSKTNGSKTHHSKAQRFRPDPAGSPGHNDIAALAYDLFLRNGAQHGHDLDHWLAAERELLSRSAGTAPVSLTSL
jgi:hypothetical protein